MAVTVLVCIPIVVAKFLGKRNSGKGERAYFGSQMKGMKGSVRPDEAIHILSSSLRDGATGLHIWVGKREKVAPWAVCEGQTMAGAA